MTSHTNNRECVWPKRFGLLVVLASLLVALLTFATASDSAAQECPDGSVLSDNGVTCEPDVSSTDSICPTGQALVSLACSASKQNRQMARNRLVLHVILAIPWGATAKPVSPMAHHVIEAKSQTTVVSV